MQVYSTGGAFLHCTCSWTAMNNAWRSSRHKFWTRWPYCHLTTSKGLHMNTKTRALHKHLLSNLLCQLPVSPMPPTQSASWHLQRKQGIWADSLWSPPSRSLSWILYDVFKWRRGRRCFPSLGKALHLFLKRCQCPKLLQFTQLQYLPISFTRKVSLLSRRNSTITWHCSWIHKTCFKGYKRALLTGHCRG